MFVLYRKKDKIYPESVEIDGVIYQINADYRNILRIFDMLNDENIPGYKKTSKMILWFFDGCLPDNISTEILTEVFIDFINFSRTENTGDENYEEEDEEYEYDYENEEDKRRFCYNFDAEEIYVGFLSEYNIDLIEADFLHWYKFKILLDNLSPDSAFKKKIELRFMDLSGFAGKPLVDIKKAKDSVQLPVYTGDTENTKNTEEIKEFNEIWGKAGNN